MTRRELICLRQYLASTEATPITEDFNLVRRRDSPCDSSAGDPAGADPNILMAQLTLVARN